MIRYLIIIFSAVALPLSAQKFQQLFNSNVSNDALLFKDRLWTASNVGLFERSVADGKVINHFTDTNSPLIDNQIFSVEGFGDEVFVGTARGLSVFNTKSRTWRNMDTAPRLKKPVYDITFDKNGNGWLASEGLIKYSSAGLSIEADKDIFYRVISVKAGPDGKVYFTTDNYMPKEKSGVHVYDGKKVWLIPETSAHKIYHPLFIDQKNSFWGSVSERLRYYSDTTWIPVTTPDNIAIPVEARFIVEDKAGNIWIDLKKDVGIFNSRTSSLEYVFAGKQSGIDNHFHNVNFDGSSRAFVIGDNGIYDVSGTKFYPYPKGIKIITNGSAPYTRFIRSFFDHNNTLWIVTSRDMLFFRDGGFRICKINDGIKGEAGQANLPHNNVKEIVSDGKRATFFATFGGLTRFHSGVSTSYNISLSYDLSFQNTSSLIFDGRGNTWVKGMAGRGYKIDSLGRVQVFDDVFPLAIIHGITGVPMLVGQRGVYDYFNKDQPVMLQGSPQAYAPVSSYCSQDEGLCWVNAGKFYLYDGKSWEMLPIKPVNHIQSVVGDQRKFTCVIGENDSIYVMRGRKVVEKYFPAGLKSGNYIGCELSGSEVLLWYRGGNRVCIKDGNMQIFYSHETNNPYLFSDALLKDRQQRYWFKYSGGAFFLENGVRNNVSFDQMQFKTWPAAIDFSVQQDDLNNIVVLTDGGVAIRRNGVWSVDEKFKVVCSLTDSKGRIWAARVGGGISILKQGTWVHLPVTELLARHVRSLHETASGHIAVNHGDGITVVSY